MVALSLYYYYVEWMVVTLHVRRIKGIEEYLQTRLPLLLDVTVVQYNERFPGNMLFFSM
jgi:hypothetical protein